VIRNDQHDGSSHQGKIFIVAGNRPAGAHLPGKATITFRNHSAHQDPAAPGSAPASRSGREDFQARPDRNAPPTPGPTPPPTRPATLRSAPVVLNVRRASAGRLVGSSHPPGCPAVRRRSPPRVPNPLVDGLRRGRPVGWSTAYAGGAQPIGRRPPEQARRDLATAIAVSSAAVRGHSPSASYRRS
jgi:hypothetical protein